MQTWFINGRHMGHAELLRWKAKQALKVEVVEPKEELPEVQDVELPAEVKETEVVETIEPIEPQELGEEETPPIIKPFCDFCDSKGRFHKKGCPLKK